MTMMNRAQSAFPHPDSSWSRKMSAKIEMSIQIQANRSMNQKIDRMMSQKFMAVSGLDGRGGRSLADRQHCGVRARISHPHGAIARTGYPGHAVRGRPADPLDGGRGHLASDGRM